MLCLLVTINIVSVKIVLVERDYILVTWWVYRC